jgi:hypothetical protein
MLLKQLNIRVKLLAVLVGVMFISCSFIIPYRAFDNPDMEFYNQYGQLIDQGDNRIYGWVINDTMTFKTLFVDNKTVLKSVKDNRNCAMSITKYQADELIIFDSVSPNCKSVVQYYKGVEGMDDLTEVPDYLWIKPQEILFYLPY